MATGQQPIRVGREPPFAVPPERRDPVRRLRGRLVAPVTVWTAGRPPGGAGLTVSSELLQGSQQQRQGSMQLPLPVGPVVGAGAIVVELDGDAQLP
jgi:hypothetical protein